MKARIPKAHTAPLILIYQPDGSPLQSGVLQPLLDDFGVPYSLIGAECLCQPVGALCGLAGCKERSFEPLPSFPHPAMVLCGFEDAKLDQLLRLLRENGLSVPHKAVLTESNKGWTLAFLLEEIEKERRAMAAAREGRKN